MACRMQMVEEAHEVMTLMSSVVLPLLTPPTVVVNNTIQSTRPPSASGFRPLNRRRTLSFSRRWHAMDGKRRRRGGSRPRSFRCSTSCGKSTAGPSSAAAGVPLYVTKQSDALGLGLKLQTLDLSSFSRASTVPFQPTLTQIHVPPGRRAALHAHLPKGGWPGSPPRQCRHSHNPIHRRCKAPGRPRCSRWIPPGPAPAKALAGEPGRGCDCSEDQPHWSPA